VLPLVPEDRRDLQQAEESVNRPDAAWRFLLTTRRRQPPSLSVNAFKEGAAFDDEEEEWIWH
jgi:hypothetical protein